MAKDFSIVVLISGRGSNLRALLEKAQHFQVIGVISDKPEASGLQFAKEFSVPTHVFDSVRFPDRKALRAAIYNKVSDLNPSAVALAGFMQILDKIFVEKFFGRLLNIHPSLLPAYPGLDTHRRVLEAREKIHGCSVHYVDSGVDTGPLIAQASCSCLPEDDETRLADRVLQLEHKLYPWALNHIAQGNIRIEGRIVRFSPEAIDTAKSENFIIAKGAD